MTAIQPTLSSTHGPYNTPISNSPRPFGYYWIKVRPDTPWIAAFWYEAAASGTMDGYFDCSNSLGQADRLVFAPSAIGGLIETPDLFDGVPQSDEQPSGFHWVQAEQCGEWVIAKWCDEPYERYQGNGHGYFDASNYWNSGCHFIVNPYRYGDCLKPC